MAPNFRTLLPMLLLAAILLAIAGQAGAFFKFLQKPGQNSELAKMKIVGGEINRITEMACLLEKAAKAIISVECDTKGHLTCHHHKLLGPHVLPSSHDGAAGMRFTTKKPDKNFKEYEESNLVQHNPKEQRMECTYLDENKSRQVLPYKKIVKWGKRENPTQEELRDLDQVVDEKLLAFLSDNPAKLAKMKLIGGDSNRITEMPCFLADTKKGAIISVECDTKGHLTCHHHKLLGPQPSSYDGAAGMSYTTMKPHKHFNKFEESNLVQHNPKEQRMECTNLDENKSRQVLPYKKTVKWGGLTPLIQGNLAQLWAKAVAVAV